MLAVFLWKCSFHIRKSDFLWFIKIWIRAQNICFLSLENSVVTYFYYRETHFHMVIVIKCQQAFSLGIFVFVMRFLNVKNWESRSHWETDTFRVIWWRKIYQKYYLWKAFQINEMELLNNFWKMTLSALGSNELFNHWY